MPVFGLAKAYIFNPVKIFDVKERSLEEESRSQVGRRILVKRKASRLEFDQLSPAFINLDLGHIDEPLHALLLPSLSCKVVRTK